MVRKYLQNLQKYIPFLVIISNYLHQIRSNISITLSYKYVFYGLNHSIRTATSEYLKILLDYKIWLD